jgi:hypothetical protein
MISYFSATREELISSGAETLLFEEEVTDYWSEDEKTAYGCGLHLMKGKNPVCYQLTFPELFSRVHFDRDGNIKCNTFKSIFSINGNQVRDDEIILGKEGISNAKLAKMLLGCVWSMQHALQLRSKETIRFSNLYPSAYLGILTQALSIRHFSNNYQYIMHALTALQRHNGIPLCVGASSGSNELKVHFPDFVPEDI